MFEILDNRKFPSTLLRVILDALIVHIYYYFYALVYCYVIALLSWMYSSVVRIISTESVYTTLVIEAQR